MIDKKTQTILFSVSLLLGIVVSVRQLVITRRNEEANETRIAVLEERVNTLEGI